MRPELVWFAEQMEEVLKQNDWKGGSEAWRKDGVQWLFQKLIEEVGELAVELHTGKRSSNPEHFIKEAIDVANIAMMLADVTEVYRKELRS